MLNLFTGSGVGPTILYLAISIFVGLLLGKIKIAKISLGITWVLFVGIALSACGVSLNAEMLHIIKEFGLILFVVAVGLQVGPGFFRSFKKGGLAMNLMALVNVALGVLITIIISKVAHQDLADMAGVYTGAITNTPGLSAAQQAVVDLGVEGGAERMAAGYAVAYPLAVVGLIVSCLLLKAFCRIDLKNEPSVETVLEPATEKQATPVSQRHKVNLIPIFIIIALGIIVGSIPIPVGMKAPIKLGLAGGPLVVAIIGSWLGVKKSWFNTEYTDSHGVWMLREVGIALFLAGVRRDHHHGTAYFDYPLRSFGIEDELLYADGFHRWLPHRPADFGFCQHHCPRRLQAPQYGICHGLSFNNVSENIYRPAVSTTGRVKQNPLLLKTVKSLMTD